MQAICNERTVEEVPEAGVVVARDAREAAPEGVTTRRLPHRRPAAAVRQIDLHAPLRF